MSNFDDAIEQILQESRKLSVFSELNMAKGGMSNQSGSQTQPVPQGNGGQAPTGQPNTGTNPAVAVQPQSGGANNNAQPNNAAVAGQPNQQAQQAQGANPDETLEFNNLLKTQQQNPDAFNRQAKILANDPQKFSRFIAHLSQPMT